MGNKRSAVTEADEDLEYTLPNPSKLKHSNGNAKVDTSGQARTAAQLVEALGPLRRGGPGDGHGHRPAREPLRAAPRARHQDVEGERAEGRPRLRARGHRRAHPRADPRQAGRGRGGAEPGAPHRAPRRRLPGGSQGLVAAHGVARQGHRRQGDRHRSRQAAAHPGGRHHRLGQVRLRERDALFDPAARHAQRGAARARGPQAGGAEPLRLDPAPAHPGDHEPAAGGQRAGQPDQGDGGALLDHEPRPHAQPGGAEPPPRARGRAAAAVHPVRDRRAGGSDDGRSGRGGGLDHPAGAEVARGGHPPAAGHPAAERGHHHRHDQGQRAGAHRVRRLVADRLPRDPRPERRRVAARSG